MLVPVREPFMGSEKSRTRPLMCSPPGPDTLLLPLSLTLKSNVPSEFKGGTATVTCTA